MADIIIIGAGPGGYETAIKAAEAGLEVIIIEKQHLGGTCLNAGCIPTKCLCHTAEAIDSMHRLCPDSIQMTGDRLLEQAVARKDSVVERLKDGIATLMKTPGITLVRGEARFVDSHSVQVGEDVYRATNIIIATGSTTKFLPIEGAHAKGVVTSTELLHITSFPRRYGNGAKPRLCIIGGGVIGMEFASIYSSFGIEVEVIEYCKEILPAFDRDTAKRLRTAMKKRGVGFHMASAARKIEENIDENGNNCIIVTFEEKGRETTLDCDLVLMAVGRAPNLDSLNIDDIGIEHSPKGIKVDSNMQTNIDGVYAVGDINGICQLAHAATFQGYCALEHILGSGTACKEALKVIPSAVFTVPEVASAGLTEEQLSEEGTEYKTLKSFYRANGKAMAIEQEEGLVKLLVDAQGHILGAHIIGAHASDLIHEAATVMRMGGTVAEIAHTVHAHPSLSEIILDAARRF